MLFQMGSQEQMSLAVVRRVEDLIEAAQQALQAKGGAKK
jgi:hypothetical protein